MTEIVAAMDVAFSIEIRLLPSAGNYSLSVPSAGGNAGQAEGLSFNYSRAESNLASYSSDEVRKMVQDLPSDQCAVAANAQKSMTDYIRQRNQGRPLWRLFLILALLSLLAEILLIRLPSKP